PSAWSCPSARCASGPGAARGGGAWSRYCCLGSPRIPRSFILAPWARHMATTAGLRDGARPR
ncbi:unnamed protein product, partial [Effrenium voratum]